MCAVKSQMPQVIEKLSTTHVNGKWAFCILGQSFYPNIRQIVFIRQRTLSSTILVALGMISGRRHHFRLTRVAEKRLCLSSPMSFTSVRVFGPLLQCFGNGSFVESFAYGPYICNLTYFGQR